MQKRTTSNRFHETFIFSNLIAKIETVSTVNRTDLQHPAWNWSGFQTVYQFKELKAFAMIDPTVDSLCMWPGWAPGGAGLLAAVSASETAETF